MIDIVIAIGWRVDIFVICFLHLFFPSSRPRCGGGCEVICQHIKFFCVFLRNGLIYINFFDWHCYCSCPLHNRKILLHILFKVKSAISFQFSTFPAQIPCVFLHQISFFFQICSFCSHTHLLHATCIYRGISSTYIIHYSMLLRISSGIFSKYLNYFSLPYTTINSEFL